MLAATQFIQELIARYERAGNTSIAIEVTDSSGTVFVSSSASRIGSYSATAMHAIAARREMFKEGSNLLADAKDDASIMSYYVPVFMGETVIGVLIVHGALNQIGACGESLRFAIESFLVYKGMQISEQDSRNARLISCLLSANPSMELIQQNLDADAMDSQRVFSAILLRVEYVSHSFFNIDLDLGYQSSKKLMERTILEIVSNNACMTQRDFFAFIDASNLLVIKSFLRVEDTSQNYLALDIVCKSLLDELRSVTSCSFHIAYGNTVERIIDVSKSYHEALKTMELGIACDPENSFYTIESILFEDICDALHLQIINKMILPCIEKLTNEEGKLCMDLVNVAEQYIDHCMRMTQAAKALYLHRNTVDAKLEQFTKLTGLDPTTSYRDSFLVKMLAVYIRQNDLGGSHAGA